jgi:hypothetical protein
VMTQTGAVTRPASCLGRPLSECCGAPLCGGPAVLWCGTCGRTVHASWPVRAPERGEPR